MAKERKKVETKEVVPEPPKRAERKPYVPPAPKVRVPIVEPEPIKGDEIVEIVEIPEPSPKKIRKKPIIDKPVIESKVKQEVKTKVSVKVPEKKLPTKPIVKKPLPKVEVVVPEKKLTKKQIEKQIENEKEDISVPQLPPKKIESILVPSTPKVKRSEDKYLSIAENAKYDERKLMTDKLFRNEVVFSHYAIDNEIGFHYYRVLTK